MLARIHEGARIALRAGDVVFHWDHAESEFPLHVGVYVGPTREVGDEPDLTVSVCGVPGRRRGSRFGTTSWVRHSLVAPTEYHASLVGAQTNDEGIDPRLVAQIALDIEAVLLDQNVLRSEGTRCGWGAELKVDYEHTIRGGLPRFERGTCSQLVELLYEFRGMDIVAQETTFDPRQPRRLYPATQIRAFAGGAYPLAICWDDRLRSYPSCLEVPGSLAESGRQKSE